MVRELLRRVGMLPPLVTRKSCLMAGFSIAYCAVVQDHLLEESANHKPQQAPDSLIASSLIALLSTVAFSPDPTKVNKFALQAHTERLLSFMKALALPHSNPAKDYVSIKTRLKSISATHSAWFAAGSGIFISTWMLGFGRKASSTEEARRILNDPDIRAANSSLIGALIDLNWHPDRVEQFFTDKVAPFLWEPNLRRWTFDENMAVMQDLKHTASAEDEMLNPPGALKRFVGALRALIEAIPIFGKTAAALLWGPRQG